MKVSFDGDATVYNTSLDKLEYEDPFYHFQGDTTSYIKVLDIVPDVMAGDQYSVLFYMGEGGYSQYEFYLENDCVTPAFTLYCDHLDFLGNGYLIARGSMNRMFPISRKYKISNGRVREIKQPFYAVNIQSEATRDFDIYLNKNTNRIVAHIEEGDPVTVLLAEFKKKHVYYLVRSSLGLTGWVRIEQETWVDETPVKDLYFHGD
jgi:hypothetical protein